MANHPNFDLAEAAADAVRRGDYATVVDGFADDIQWENGPGAGPWHKASGKDDLALLLLEFAAFFGDTFHQDGRCIYADDRVIISQIHETGTAASGDKLDNLAVCISRVRPDGPVVERAWTLTSTPSTARSPGDAIMGSHPKTSDERRVAPPLRLRLTSTRSGTRCPRPTSQELRPTALSGYPGSVSSCPSWRRRERYNPSRKVRRPR